MMRVVLLGDPVAHSLSPAFQQAAFDAAGLDWQYEAIEVPAERLAEAVERMREEAWAGGNVTIPHKETVIPMLDELDHSASATSAVNTIVNDGGHLIGHNSDLPAFVRDLKAHWQVPGEATALILGAGGAARAVAFGLAQHELHLRLIARTEARAELVAEEVRGNHAIEIEVYPWTDEAFKAASSECDLVINATPLGMATAEQIAPWPEAVALPPTAFVYDLVYIPEDTPLVQRARASGLQSASGAGMLVEQGAIAFELWTGLRAPRRRMRAALDRALERYAVRHETSEVRDA